MTVKVKIDSKMWAFAKIYEHPTDNSLDML